MADFYWIGPSNGNWSTIGNWSSTSGGVSNGVIPGPDDNVIFARLSSNNSNIVNQPFTIKNLTYIGGSNSVYYDGVTTIYSATGYDYSLIVTDTLIIGSPPDNNANPRRFSGTSGWQTANALNTGNNGPVILQSDIKYNIKSSFISRTGYPRSGNANWCEYVSSSSVDRAKLILDNPAVCNVMADFRRIDASSGRTITTWISIADRNEFQNAGRVFDCINVVNYPNIRGTGNPPNIYIF